MGRKQARTGKYIYLYVASLTLLFLFVFGCATLRDREDYLLRSQRLIAKGDFERALEANQRVLSIYGNRPPGDEALFSMGLIYAHYGNPNKDYKKAFSLFWRLITECPQSPLYEEAKIWTGVLNAIEETEMKKAGQRSAFGHLLRSQRLIAKGDFEGALEANQKVLSIYGNRPPGDEALFSMGLIYAHYGNPNKDYKKAFGLFGKVIKEFPQSPLYEEAKIWIGVLQVIEKSKQVDIEIEKMKKARQRSAFDHLLRSQRLIAKGDFERALEANQKVLSIYGNRPPGDEALFSMGLIYAHYGNPNKDYKKAFGLFGRLIKEFPQSSLYEEAKIWIGVLQVIEKSKQVDIEIEKMKQEVFR